MTGGPEGRKPDGTPGSKHNYLRRALGLAVCMSPVALLVASAGASLVLQRRERFGRIVVSYRPFRCGSEPACEYLPPSYLSLAARYVARLAKCLRPPPDRDAGGGPGRNRRLRRLASRSARGLGTRLGPVRVAVVSGRHLARSILLGFLNGMLCVGGPPRPRHSNSA